MPAGKAQSLYGLLTGQDMPLTHYAKFDDGQLLFLVSRGLYFVPWLLPLLLLAPSQV